MTSEELDQIEERGRMFYEVFPGTAASDAWMAHWPSHAENQDRRPDRAREQPNADETHQPRSSR